MIKKIIILFISILCLLGSINAQIIDTVCPGETNVRYSVQNNIGSTYIWNVVGGTIKAGNGTAEILVDWKYQTGLFTISAMEKNISNCYGNQVLAYVLVKKENFQVNFPQNACINDTITLWANGGDKYLWNNGDTNSSIRVRIIQDTSFMLKISNKTCELIADTFNMNIKAISNPLLAFTPNDEEFYKDKNIYFKYLGDKNDNVTWVFDKTAINKIIANNANVTFLDTGQTLIKLTAVNVYGCKDSISKMINVKDESIFIPNAFTPNGDGTNDYFKPVGHGIKTFRMVIFNRWGEEIFVSNSMSVGWNGTYKGESVPTDVFGYKIEAVGNSGKNYFFNDTVTLLR